MRAGDPVVFDVALLDGALHLVDANAPRRERVGVEPGAHGILLRPEHLHLSHATDRREPLSDMRIGKLIELQMKDYSEARVKEMCDKLLANPVIEDYQIEVVA